MQKDKVLRIVGHQNTALASRNAKHIIVADAAQGRQSNDAENIVTAASEQGGDASGHVLV